LAEVKAALPKMVDLIEKTSEECDNPNIIATAFGIIVDKNCFGVNDEETSMKKKEGNLTQKEAASEYKELLKLEEN